MVALKSFIQSHHLKTFSVSVGEIIFKVGDGSDEMYLVQEGKVEIRLGAQLVKVIEAGEILSEIGEINSLTRTATAIARTNCQLMAVKAEQFSHLPSNDC